MASLRARYAPFLFIRARPRLSVLLLSAPMDSYSYISGGIQQQQRAESVPKHAVRNACLGNGLRDVDLGHAGGLGGRRYAGLRRCGR